jgi:preprotein translocase subunit YajC
MNGYGFFFIIVIFGLLWLVMVRPQKRRQQEQRRMIDNLKVGDEVLTAAGIYGEVTGLRDDDVIVEIAPDVEVRVARRAIGGVIPAPEEDEEPPEPEEPDEAEASKEAEVDPATETPVEEQRG